MVWNQSVVPCPVLTLLLDLPTAFSGGRSGDLVFPFLEEVSSVYCDLHKDFGNINKAVDVFLVLSCFFNDPAGVGNLISGSSVFSKSSLNIWKFSVSCTVEAWLGEF